MRILFKICVLSIIHVVVVFRDFFRTTPPHAHVLMYHSVEESGWRYSVTPEIFERQMAYLKKYYNVVPLSDIVSFVRKETAIPERAIAITIDDGYQDTYDTVFPALQRYGLPATVFLTTDLSKRPELGSFERLNGAQIKEMADSGLVAFEVHGREHKNLAKLDVDSKEFEEEVLGCRDDIKALTGHESHYIAYAAGNRSKEVQDKLETFGFTAGFGITEGIVQKGDHPMALRRVQVDNTMPFLLFRLRLTRAIASYRILVKALRFWR